MLLGLASAVFVLVATVVTIFVNLVCVVWTAIAGSDDTSQ